jgi:hypothetical protein
MYELKVMAKFSKSYLARLFSRIENPCVVQKEPVPLLKILGLPIRDTPLIGIANDIYAEIFLLLGSVLRRSLPNSTVSDIFCLSRYNCSACELMPYKFWITPIESYAEGIVGTPEFVKFYQDNMAHMK